MRIRRTDRTIARGAVMALIVLSLCMAIPSAGHTQEPDNGTENIPPPAKAPIIPETPEKRPDLLREGERNSLDTSNPETDWKAEELPENIEAQPNIIELTNQPPLPEKKTHARRGASKGRREIAGPPPLPENWSEAEIKTARAQCGDLLSDSLFDFKPLEPIRKGVCGTPAPVLLNAVNAGETVTVRPGAKLNCLMAKQLHRWLVEIVQSSAKTHLDTDITGVINIASYHCRPRYNDSARRISQHAYANALDLAGFITAKGEQIAVQKFWNGDTPQSLFLREVHAGACKIFGTVLGPEANEAHKDHFHLDMTKRKNGSYCE